jgi:Xaa-Pro aminopeptidase
MGYCSDITRTGAVGGAAMSDDQRVVWNAVNETLQSSLLLHTAGLSQPMLHAATRIN